MGTTSGLTSSQEICQVFTMLLGILVKVRVFCRQMMVLWLDANTFCHTIQPGLQVRLNLDQVLVIRPMPQKAEAKLSTPLNFTEFGEIGRT